MNNQASTIALINKLAAWDEGDLLTPAWHAYMAHLTRHVAGNKKASLRLSAAISSAHAGYVKSYQGALVALKAAI